MFVGIANTPRDYAWGSKTDIATLLQRGATGGPEAEYWLGTHPGSPSTLVGDSGTLADLATLPFIMKVLAAETPVSLQAHPSTEQAIDGFARENAEGIALDAPNRNYKDAHHKPELIYAVSDTLSALCGFRPVAATREILARLGDDELVRGWLVRLVDDASLPATFEWLLSGDEEIGRLLDFVVARSATLDGPEFATVVSLARDYPGDPGILVSLLLNRVEVNRGEVVYLPAGNIHSYLHGLGIEVLAASDNVLRGGLTPKHVDVPELLHVLDFRPLPVPFLAPERPSPGVEVFAPDVPDFELVVIRPAGREARFVLAAEAILLCTGGSLTVTSASGRHEVTRGESFYLTADEGGLVFGGTGTVFLTTTNPSA